jgi:hypothetical protein
MNDFDFLTGTWDIANRRRTDLLHSGSELEQFPAVSHASRLFGGNPNYSVRLGMGSVPRRGDGLGNELDHGDDLGEAGQ